MKGEEVMENLSGVEKRKHPRLMNTNLPLKFQVGRPDKNTFWVLRDISKEGARVEFLIIQDPPNFKVSDEIPFSLSIMNPYRDIYCKAQVKRIYYETRGTNRVCGLGLQFKGIDETSKEKLSLFIEERSN
jgi:hypothetical protein